MRSLLGSHSPLAQSRHMQPRRVHTFIHAHEMARDARNIKWSMSEGCEGVRRKAGRRVELQGRHHEEGCQREDGGGVCVGGGSNTKPGGSETEQHSDSKAVGARL